MITVAKNVTSDQRLDASRRRRRRSSARLPRVKRPEMRVASLLGTVALALCGTLTGCQTNSGSDGAAPNSPTRVALSVVASTDVWGNIVEQIGGNHVDVTSILSDPNADPHEFEADAKTASTLSKSKFVIENGLGYDDFMDKLLSASPQPNRNVLNVADVMRISSPDANPHLWYGIAKLPDVANAIADRLGTADPPDAPAFIANANTFIASLKPINDAISDIRAKFPGAPVGYTERVPGYLVQAAGLKLATPASFAQSIEDGNDPSVADNAAMNAALAAKAIKVLLYNGQVTSPATEAVQQLAQKNGIPVVGVTETLPTTDEDFQAWQLRQIGEISTAIGGQ
jgi:zinc/manganese transport system substrate-binding protein